MSTGTHAIFCIADYGIKWTWQLSDNAVTACSLQFSWLMTYCYGIVDFLIWTPRVFEIWARCP